MNIGKINIEPVAKGRPCFVRKTGRTYTPKKTRQYERILIAELKKLKATPLDGPLSLSIAFEMTRPKTVKREHPSVKPDLDNLLKAFCDAANGILWHDDAQVVSVTMSKVYGEGAIKFICRSN